MSAFLKKLILSRNSHCNKTSSQTFCKITYNTIILAHCAIKFLDLNFVCVSEVLTYLDYIFSPALAWDKIKSKKA